MHDKIIKPLFLDLMSIQSDTNTPMEVAIEKFIYRWIGSQPYFFQRDDLYGLLPLEDDPHGRNVVWSLLKGKGKETVVMIHHHDAVDIEEYGKLKHHALIPDQLEKALKERKLSQEVRRDLESGEWIFGRGSADMKSGAAIQLALLSKWSENPEFQGNILLLSVPDEERLSQGMLQAVPLMTQLREKHDLEFVLTVNCEPYFNQKKGHALYYEGSVGKVMPILYVKGVKSHIGDPFNGFNPSLVLADLQRKTELNVDLCDVHHREATPPPVWVNLKDRKKAYDASIPEAATGYFNWLTFTRSTHTIMSKLVSLSKRTLRDTLNHFEDAYENYCNLTGQEPDFNGFEPQVITFKDLYQQGCHSGDTFIAEYTQYQAEVNALLRKNKINLPEAATRLIEFIVDWLALEGPAIVVALSGPYYPHINNDSIDRKMAFDLHRAINEFSQGKYNVFYEKQGFFMGISDLSYASWSGQEEDIAVVKENSPGWDIIYHIPFDELSGISMPVVNIGPWGKDLHKTTERVFAKDVYERIPDIVEHLVQKTLTTKN